MLALAGATIFPAPADEVVHDGTVLIDGATVAAVGPRTAIAVPHDALVIDCSRCTITAGFWNAHVHFFERKWADAASIPPDELSAQLCEMSARFGFTSVFDIGSKWENSRTIRDRIDSGEVRGPRVFSTGEALLPPHALPEETVFRTMGVMSFPAPEVSSASEAAAAAESLLSNGVDGIKIFASSPRSAALAQDVLEAAVESAHHAGKPVFVHPNNGDDVLRALNAGVDVIAHTTPSSGRWDEAIFEKAAERGAALTPTLMLWKAFLRHDRRSMQSAAVETAIAQLRAWHERGLTVLFGTDLGAVDYDPKDEYLMMVQAGMRFTDVLASLTTVPAERFACSAGSGRVAAGEPADLVVLNRDPSTDVEALTDVRFTVRNGSVIYDGKVTG